MIRRASIATVVLAGVAVVVALPAAANHSWKGFHWARTKNPVVVTIGDNVDVTWKTNLQIAAADWAASSVVNTAVVAGKGCGQYTSGRVEVCTKDYGGTGWMASTELDVGVGLHILGAIVKLNNRYLPATKPAKRQMAICHELGHSLGLAHQDENFSNTNLGSCLDYTSKPTGPPANDHPNKGDYDQLLCIYDPAYKGVTLKTPTHSCKGTGHLDASFQSEEAPGTPIGAPQRLEDDLYVQNLNNGHQRYTWVLWANPRAAHAKPPSGG